MHPFNSSDYFSFTEYKKNIEICWKTIKSQTLPFSSVVPLYELLPPLFIFFLNILRKSIRLMALSYLYLLSPLYLSYLSYLSYLYLLYIFHLCSFLLHISLTSHISLLSLIYLSSLLPLVAVSKLFFVSSNLSYLSAAHLNDRLPIYLWFTDLIFRWITLLKINCVYTDFHARQLSDTLVRGIAFHAWDSFLSHIQVNSFNYLLFRKVVNKFWIKIISHVIVRVLYLTQSSVLSVTQILYTARTMKIFKLKFFGISSIKTNLSFFPVNLATVCIDTSDLSYNHVHV